jgi:hypothetical protein
MMNQKYLSIMGIIILLTGCGAFSKTMAYLTDYSRYCINGVSYLQFTSGATVEYTKEGNIKTCD